MEYKSRDPVGAGLNIWNSVKITLTLAGEPSLRRLIPLCSAEDCTRPVGGLLCCEVQPVGQEKQDGGHQQVLAGQLEGGRVASASVASASSLATVAAISHPPNSLVQCRAEEEISLKINVKLTVHIICEEKSRDRGSRDLGARSGEIVPFESSSEKIPPPDAVRTEGVRSNEDHLWCCSGSTEEQPGCCRGGRADSRESLYQNIGST